MAAKVKSSGKKDAEPTSIPESKSFKGYQALANIITPLKRKPTAGVDQKSAVTIPKPEPPAEPIPKLNVQQISHVVMLFIALMLCCNGVLMIRQLRFSPFLLGLGTIALGVAMAAVELVQNLNEYVNEYAKFWNATVAGRAICLMFLALVSLNQPMQQLGRILSLIQLIATVGWWGLLGFSAQDIPLPLFKLEFPLFRREGRDVSQEETIFLPSDKF